MLLVSGFFVRFSQTQALHSQFKGSKKSWQNVMILLHLPNKRSLFRDYEF